MIKKIWCVLKYYLLRDKNAFMYLLREEAFDYLEQCSVLGVGDIEEVEDLIFHINSYLEIPEVLEKTEFPEIPSIKENIKEHFRLRTELLEEVEKERAVERECICDLLKTLPIGFKI